MRPDTNHAGEADAQARLWTYERIIKRYLRYRMIRCTCFTNDKTAAQRIAFYALVTACLSIDRLEEARHLGRLIDGVVDLAGQGVHAPRCGETPVLTLDDRMCEVAGAVNTLPGPLRKLLVLYHIEGLDSGVLADAEAQFTALLARLSSHYGREGLEGHGLLIQLAACLDLLWAEEVGGAALWYASAWDDPDARADLPWLGN